MPEIKEVIHRVADSVRKPTDVEIADRLLERSIKTVVSVPCSITAPMDAYWDQLSRDGKMRLIKATHEHSLVGIASGIYLGSGEMPMIHMQNSGFSNAADGFVSFAKVYKVPTLAMVTWRGNDLADDSEPHQEIGNITDALTKIVGGKKGNFGSRAGRGILRSVDKAVDRAQDGEISILRLSPNAFKKTYPVNLYEPDENWELSMQKKREERIYDRRLETENIFGRVPIARVEAMEQIVKVHPDAAINFANGFTCRAGQHKVDRTGNFYNTGYMGGTLAIGWGMAISNPDLEVVVVDGDQNAQMSNMKDNLYDNFPPNLKWYILDNGIGASVGVSRSLKLAPWYYEMANVIKTVPDNPGEFNSPRVGANGVYFNTNEAMEMAELIGPLPTHFKRCRNWVVNQNNRTPDHSKSRNLYSVA